jgi:hypothetical protein
MDVWCVCVCVCVCVRFSVFVYRQRPCDELITRPRSPADCLRSSKLKAGQGQNWGCSAKGIKNISHIPLNI